MTATDLEIFVDVDLDATIPCEAKDCDQEATWRAIRKCCDMTFVCCEEHMRRTIDHDKAVDARTALRGDASTARCGACGVSDPPDLIWTKL